MRRICRIKGVVLVISCLLLFLVLLLVVVELQLLLPMYFVRVVQGGLVVVAVGRNGRKVAAAVRRGYAVAVAVAVASSSCGHCRRLPMEDRIIVHVHMSLVLLRRCRT